MDGTRSVTCKASVLPANLHISLIQSQFFIRNFWLAFYCIQNKIQISSHQWAPKIILFVLLYQLYLLYFSYILLAFFVVPENFYLICDLETLILVFLLLRSLIFFTADCLQFSSQLKSHHSRETQLLNVIQPYHCHSLSFPSIYLINYICKLYIHENISNIWKKCSICICWEWSILLNKNLAIRITNNKIFCNFLKFWKQYLFRKLRSYINVYNSFIIILELNIFQWIEYKTISNMQHMYISILPNIWL